MLEKRLDDRLTKYWELLKKDETLPAFGKFNTAAIDDIWDSCVLFSVSKGGSSDNKNYTFHRMGDKVRKLYNEDLTGSSLKPKQKATKGATIVKRIDEVVTQLIPIYDSGQFVSDNQKIVKFRSCLLPFGNDNDVTHVVAGLSWREF